MRTALGSSIPIGALDRSGFYGWYSGTITFTQRGAGIIRIQPRAYCGRYDAASSRRARERQFSADLGPDYYYQKQFFSGHDDPLSTPRQLMHYDLEVSGFLQAIPVTRAAQPKKSGLSGH